jgi:TetR/AcrR family transcriptional regulator
MTQLSRQEREWNQRHQEILLSAASLFLHLGFPGTTMQMIADQAEFSVGYIYKHFSGKTELMVELIDGQLDQYENLRAKVRTEFAGQPLRILREMVEQSANSLQDQAHMLPLFLSTDSPGPDRIRQRFEKARREDENFFRQAQELKQIRPCDPALVAAALDGAFMSLVRKFMEQNQLDRMTEIPRILENLFFTPLTRGCSDRAFDPAGKDHPTP